MHAEHHHLDAAAPVDGRTTYLLITAEQFGLGAAERSRYAEWLEAQKTDAKASGEAERAHDVAFNEAGEGFNPHRTGAQPSYTRARTLDRDYPPGA